MVLREWERAQVKGPVPGPWKGAVGGCRGADLLFALGRETPRTAAAGVLTRTWRRYSSPAGALMVAGAASVAALLAFGFEHTATRAATLIIQYGAYLILAAYLMTVIAALAWTWRTRRRPLPLAVLAIGAMVLGYVVYRTFAPFPASPFGWVVLASAASTAAGATILLLPGVLARLRRSQLPAVTAVATACGGRAQLAGLLDLLALARGRPCTSVA